MTKEIIPISQQIKDFAYSLGFDACGFCKAETVADQEQTHLRQWLDMDYHAGMGYMANHFDKRCNPTLLVEGAKSIICVALNYYPEKKQPVEAPQFAYYAYGKDYHDVMKEKLQGLFDYIKTLNPLLTGRVFCDTAPVLERYWAAKSGIGFVGKNSLLIIPNKGSYFFLGELIVDMELDYDMPINVSCGNCRRCVDACPTQAIVEEKVIDSNLCISYQTIENKGEIDSRVASKMGKRIYGCDACQQVCPWNRYATANRTAEFAPSEAFLAISEEYLERMNVEEYQQLFKGSAVKRAKLEGLKRNLAMLKDK